MTTLVSDYTQALEAWSQLLGPANVVTAEDALRAVATTTFATTQQVPAIIRPANRAEVQECIRIANTYRTPIYPISRGKNYGYGSRVPSADGCVVLDLGRMNRIVELNEQLGYVTVEPGVTQEQLHNYLVQHNTNLILSVTGSSADSSLIGNLAERGVGQGPNSDRFSNVCALEVVLPNGELLQTGFGRFANAKATPVHKWGVGPYLDGLFTQSNLGIITQATFHLLPKPKYFQTFFFTIDDELRLSGLVDAILSLRLQGLIVGGYTIYNDYRIVSLGEQYPWDSVGGVTPLPNDYLRAAMQRMWGKPTAWMGLGSLHTAGALQGIGVRMLLTKALKPWVNRLVVFDPPTNAVIKAYANFTKNQQYLLGVHSYETSHFLGNPIGGGMVQAYWRRKITPNMADLDPDRDQCGALWFAPAVPATGRDISTILPVLKDIITRHGFEPNLGLNWAQDRAIDITVCVHYDRTVPGEDARAMACYDELADKIFALGYYPYRLGVQGQGHTPPPQDSHGAVIKAIKQALDPNDILAPGRYDFRATWPADSDKEPI